MRRYKAIKLQQGPLQGVPLFSGELDLDVQFCFVQYEEIDQASAEGVIGIPELLVDSMPEVIRDLFQDFSNCPWLQ